MLDNPAHDELHVNFFSDPERDHAWRRWVGKEIQHRASLGLYVVDGLLAQMAGEPTAVRHASNQLALSDNDKAFEATTAEEWMSCMRQIQPNHSNTTFRSVLNTLFSHHAPTPAFNTSTFSLRIILESIQSLLSECASDTERIIGVPSISSIRSALSRIHHTITSSPSISPADRLETLLRWHGICLDATVDTSLLCHELCSRWNIEQHIWTGASAPHSNTYGAPWARTEDARRSLLHATAIQNIVETLPRGRAHAVHMPTSLFAAATVYAAVALGEVVTVRVVESVDWRIVLGNGEGDGDTMRYIRGDGVYCGESRNLVYELNSMHKLMGCLKTQWGVATDMEGVVGRWVEVCH
jgi:hypothetical protein